MLNSGLLAKALISRKIIDAKKLKELAVKNKREGIDFEELLLNEELIDPEELAKIKAEILGIPFVDLTEKIINREVLGIISRNISENYKIIAFDKKDGFLFVGMVNPQDFKALEAIDFLAKKEGLEVKIFIITKEQFKDVVKKYDTLPDEMKEMLLKVPELTPIEEGKIKGAEKLEEIIKSAPISKMVLVLIKHAIEGRASDIHIEPQAKETRVRYRVDGILHTTILLPKYIHSSVISRIKVLANLKLDEARKPQDGRIRLNISGQNVDFRVSTLPLIEGEKVVMRILKSNTKLPSLEKLGFNPVHIKVTKQAIKKPHGAILLTGPTGSGKTTTLYTILSMLNSDGTNIITLEDPIEYNMEGINQSQIHPEVGYTFASGLRSILRQDPNVIMLGEIRDEESAELAIHASLTGHKVFSTLHTNNAIGAVPRLLDMHVEPFLLGSTLNLIIAQRLARKICPDCKIEAKVSPEVLKGIHQEFDLIPDIYKKDLKTQDLNKLWFGKGCPRCGNLGYKERIGILEVVNFTSELQGLVSAGFKEEEVEEELRRQKFITLRQDCILKVLQGLTTVEEIIRVTQL